MGEANVERVGPPPPCYPPLPQRAPHLSKSQASPVGRGGGAVGMASLLQGPLDSLALLRGVGARSRTISTHAGIPPADHLDLRSVVMARVTLAERAEWYEEGDWRTNQKHRLYTRPIHLLNHRTRWGGACICFRLLPVVFLLSVLIGCAGK